ncbi:MAG: tyrosine protein phosphatase [Actinomycetota bacterium]|nr:tyrosine protein phosphatase [Actinomycetota bacterium]
MIDLHSHILPGLDDGARTIAESVEMARAAVADGIRVLAATPHVRDDYPTPVGRMELHVAALREAFTDAGVPLDLRPGGEIALDQLSHLSVETLRRFGLAGNPRVILLEFPYYGWPLDLADRVFGLRAAGIRPVLAHPERNADVQEAPERLRPLVDAGALVQLTAASVDGRLGRAPRKAANDLLELELAHLVASDAHSPAVRGIGMSAAAQAIGDRELARWLTTDVPGAVVAAERLPERPVRKRRRGLLERLRR